MTDLPEVPRYLVSRGAMFAWRENGMLTDQIGMVTYADHLTAMQAQRETALREALALVRERETDLLSCHKDDECRAYARIAGVIAEDIQSELIDGGDTR